ncbi:MAG: MATE family efflux transporter, partial [Holdemanella sp.]|nr:MATE family efflux transporter [Holdemanella sp.]
LFSKDLIRIFRDDPVVIEIANRALKLQCLTLVTIPLCMVSEMLYQSTGKKLGAALLSSMRSGLIFIPVLVILATLRGLKGIQEAQPLAYIISMIPGIIAYKIYMDKLPIEKEA